MEAIWEPFHRTTNYPPPEVSWVDGSVVMRKPGPYVPGYYKAVEKRLLDYL
ncbi:hypothetical protein [Palaeococcus ferrophilus]|uniref:hypothetical protein n=1 Tax=Palaeococcus ferrophilus TaxID=83868 RepID=UPI0012FA4DF3|nr:hypothetical protein [Palaeococcus ferrophilus]